MKRLRITRHSAFILGLRRLLWVDRWRAHPLRPAPPEVPPGKTPPGPQGNGNGNGGIDPEAGAPARSYSPWLLIGLILLGIIVAKACAAGSKGGLQAVNIPNVPYFLAALVAVVAVSLHTYTMEVWIWPKLKDEGFPTTRFGDPSVTKGFYRTVWNFFTVSWLATIILMFFFAFGDVIPYVNLIVGHLIIYWMAIVATIFIVTALSLEPGDSYVRTLIKAFQWVIVLIMVGLMYWGTKV